MGSTGTILAPDLDIAIQVAIYVFDGTITSSSFFKFKHLRLRYKASRPLPTPKENLEPTKEENFLSKFRSSVHKIKYPDFITLFAEEISFFSSKTFGFKLRNSIFFTFTYHFNKFIIISYIVFFVKIVAGKYCQDTILRKIY